MNKKNIIIVIISVIIATIMLVLIQQGFLDNLVTNFLGDTNVTDNSEVIDFSDQEQFLKLYEAKDIRADLDNNNIVDYQDVTLYINLYQQK